MKKPTVSLIIGDSHSIGVPLAVSTDYSFIVPTATMIIHPVRMNGTLIGVQQTYDYFERISDRITSFIAAHSSVSKERVEEMMVDTTQLSKDLGTVLVGRQALAAYISLVIPQKPLLTLLSTLQALGHILHFIISPYCVIVHQSMNPALQVHR